MDMATRRGGVFLTPLPFAKKAYEYLDNTLGSHWTQTGEYRLWDMAAGTGHLELSLPKDFLQYCYLSTLEEKDVQHLAKDFPSATVFQYDYLNDGEDKMPDALRKDLKDPNIKWIIWVNPPYATAQEAGLKGTSKEGVSNTKIRTQMHADGLGEVSRELYVQFLYRMMNEFKHRETLLGLFSPLKYLVSTNYQKFRDNIFQAEFQSGFIFSSENFGGTSKTSHFPVAFILWDIHRQRNNTTQKIELDILDSTAEKIGVKTLKPENRNDFLSRWIKRPRGTSVFPPFSSALTVKSDNIDTRNRIAEGFLASLMCPGNELQNQQQTAFLSGPQVSAGALSVTPDNFEQAVVVFAARRVPKDSWINHVDQLLRPNSELLPQFIIDCAVWSLFDNKNQTVALRNVVYQGKVYQVANHFFPFSITEVQGWKINDKQIASSLCEAKNSFVADWLHSCPLCLCEGQHSMFSHKSTKGTKLSAEAQIVLTSAKVVYRFYFAHLHSLRRTEFKIDTYDAGWYQIRQALLDAKLGTELLTDLKYKHDQLKEKILLQLHDYGMVR